MNSEQQQNDAHVMDEIVKNFILNEQKNMETNEQKNEEKNNNAKTYVNAMSVTDVVVSALPDTVGGSSREGDLELIPHDKVISTRSEISPEHVILISPLINRLLNKQALPEPQITNIFKSDNKKSQINNLQHFDMDNTVYNIHHLMRNKLSQFNSGLLPQGVISNNKITTKRRMKLPLIYYSPFISDDQILDLPSDFENLAGFNPNDCCGESPSQQSDVLDRISRGMKFDQANKPKANSKMLRHDISGKRLNDKFNAEMDTEEVDADIIMENISLNGPAANYRSDGHSQHGYKYNELPELRISNPFERTTPAPPPVLNNDGIYINKLKIRKGGIAIAGPNGVATAGSGGTAIVGPGGLAYTKPNGLAVAGPGARVISVPSSTNLHEFFKNVDTLAQGRSNAGDFPIPEGARIVALGPIIYYNKDDNV